MHSKKLTRLIIFTYCSTTSEQFLHCENDFSTITQRHIGLSFIELKIRFGTNIKR